MDKFFIPLERNSSIKLACTFIPSATPRPSPASTLIVFINGIECPQTFWNTTISAAFKTRENGKQNFPPIVTFDRPGQGKTIGRYPDVSGRPQGHGQDCIDAAHDLREVVAHVATTRLGVSKDKVNDLDLVIVAFSIGCAIARLYAQLYPRTITGLMFLDSTLANSDTVSVFPDPSSPSFSEERLPDGVTVKDCSDARENMRMTWHHESPNREGLWRGTLPSLLPKTDFPKIEGSRPGTPYITVIGNDPDTLAEQNTRASGISKAMIKAYMSTAWQQYNEDLAKLTSKDLSKGPIIAKGAGHFIIRDNPQIVAEELVEILDKLCNSGVTASRI